VLRASCSPRRRTFLPRVGKNPPVARSALVTGGSSGIGLAIARMLREEGYELTLAARGQARLEAAAAELGAQAVTGDVRNETDCERIVSAHRERSDSLDVLVNSAGVGVGSRIEELRTKDLDLQLNVNLRGLLLVTRAASPLLKEARGLIVNLSSLAGTVPGPGLSVYAATKAAVISLTSSLNAELELDGVRATALCPGFVDTPMAAWSSIPSEQMIQPEDCAEVVRALLRLSPSARIPTVVIERVGAGSY
jgi:NADP-dependent 3-hydroxy acid dehydrogenase YdfG